jgi:hypothetical protein
VKVLSFHSLHGASEADHTYWPFLFLLTV